MSFGGPSEILSINATTGNQTVVSSGGDLAPGPEGLSNDGTDPGNVLVAEDGSTKSLLRVNEASGAQSVISSGGLLSLPDGVAQDAAGDTFLTNGTDVVEVNLTTGAQQEVVDLISPRGIVVVPEPAGLALATFVVGTLGRRRRATRVRPRRRDGASADRGGAAATCPATARGAVVPHDVW
jgi:hypothetical protein